MDIFTQEEIQAMDAVKEQLALAEQDMERADRHKFEVWGAKLKLIRDNKWYIAFESGCTWERYIQERWEMSFQRAHQIIIACEILAQLTSTLVDKSSTKVELPTRETHIRPLTKLEKPELRAEVWQRVIANTDGRNITAKIVEAEVQRKQAELEKDWITLDEWQKLSEDECQRILTQPNLNTKPMNQVNENIEWALWSWNPVTGCLNNCPYCYARDIANRFYPQHFQPTFKPSRLTAPTNTKVPSPRWQDDIGYRGVFVCSMADLFGDWVPEEWINATLRTIATNPQWNFLLLTKFPIRMAEFVYPPNVWLGTTVDRQHRVEQAEEAFSKIKASGFDGICWLSCEPMMECLTFPNLDVFDWVVMGGASKSSQTPEYRPPIPDIVHLYNQAHAAKCKIYWKTNLIPGMSDSQRIREYPTL